MMIFMVVMMIVAVDRGGVCAWSGMLKTTDVEDEGGVHDNGDGDGDGGENWWWPVVTEPSVPVWW